MNEKKEEGEQKGEQPGMVCPMCGKGELFWWMREDRIAVCVVCKSVFKMVPLIRGG